MATGYDIHKYNRTKEIAEQHNIEIVIEGDSFGIYRKDGSTLGKVENVDKLYYFITGYDWGYSTCKAIKSQNGIKDL